MAVIRINDICLIKATLSDRKGRTEGNPFRVLALPKTMSLYELADAIIASFDFDLDHAFGFYDNIMHYPRSREAYELFAEMRCESGFSDVRKTRIFKAFPVINKKMLLVFDYDAGWRFIVELVGTEEKPSDSAYPKIVESSGIAPRQYTTTDMEDNENGDKA